MIPAFFQRPALPFLPACTWEEDQQAHLQAIWTTNVTLKPPLSSNHVVRKKVADEIQQPSCNLGHYGSAEMKRRKSARGET